MPPFPDRPIAVSLGDPAGIGPEVIAKCWDNRGQLGVPPFVATGDPRSIAAVWDGPIEIGRVRLDPAKRTATLNGEPVELARKEFDLLALLMREAGAVVTRERLIDEVWDVNWFWSTKTLDVHISTLRKKLEPALIHTARGVGFRFTAP